MPETVGFRAIFVASSEKRAETIFQAIETLARGRTMFWVTLQERITPEQILTPVFQDGQVATAAPCGDRGRRRMAEDREHVVVLGAILRRRSIRWPEHWRWRFGKEVHLCNLFFLLLGAALLLTGLVRILTPPSRAVVGAIYPYTTAGKQQTCLTRLRTLGLAVSMYLVEHEEAFPPLSHEAKPGEVVTWVDLLRPYAREAAGPIPSTARWGRVSPGARGPLSPASATTRSWHPGQARRPCVSPRWFIPP